MKMMSFVKESLEINFEEELTKKENEILEFERTIVELKDKNRQLQYQNQTALK